MPPRIKITPPPKPVTEEEIKQNQKYIDKMNDVLSRIAHSWYVEPKKTTQ